ncbi:MAG: DMT family transporter [Rhodobacteraceae bacterium]|nr:DMT family transporter [Paracoccaceae bacterium]
MSQTHRPVAAALWMSGAILGFSSMAVAGRQVGHALDTFEVMLYRSVIGFLIVLAVATITGKRREISRRNLGLHLMRNSAHFAGQNLWFYALSLIPLAQLFAIEFSYPIMVALAAPLFLGERMTRIRVLVALLGFTGILIVARPFGAAGLSLGILTALLSAVGFATTAIFTKRLTRVASITCILFWLTLIQLGLGLVFAGWDGDIALPGPGILPWVILIGFAGLGAHYCLTTALSLAPASIVTPIDFLRLPVIAVVGMVLYGEALDLWVFVGGGIIFGANWLNILTESRRRAENLGLTA